MGFIKTLAILLFAQLFYLTSIGQTQKDSLIVFVGEKIEVRYFPKQSEDSISFDSRFIAKYKVLKLINGFFTSDTIEFLVYDHYGEPAFSKFQTVLLFVSSYNGTLYHEKYQYFDLYMTDSGEWASPYSVGDYSHPYEASITVKPEKIRFKDQVSFPLENLTKKEIKMWFPKPYYEIKNGYAIAIYGNYIDDLFTLKKQTILKARGIY